MIDLSSIMIGTGSVKVMADFYEKVFGRKADWSEEGGFGWQVGKGFLMVGEHSEVIGKAKEPQRMLINFETREVKAEFDRIKALGAEVVKEPYEMGGAWIATFADPDGNYFQLMTPWEAPEAKV